MLSNKNNNRIEDIESLSQLDPGAVLRDVHSYPGHYLRTRDALTIVKQSYDYLTATYSGNLPTQVKYYVGLLSQITRVTTISDISGSLNNKYFLIYEGRSSKKFYVWYDVDGLGADPLVTDGTGIKVSINSNDNAQVISLATSLMLNSNQFKEYFTANVSGALIVITANKTGETTDSIDFNSGFTIVNEQGTSSLVKTVDIKYLGSDPLFEGQVLKNYYYDIFKGSFEKNQTLDTAVIWDEIQTTFPSESSELYSYKLNGNLVQTMLVTYQDSTKRIILNVERTRV